LHIGDDRPTCCIASTADELSGGTNIDDLERPRTPKLGLYSEFFAISGCHTQFKSELREMTGDKPSMKFSALNPDFNTASFNHLGSRSPAYERIKSGYPFENAISATVD